MHQAQGATKATCPQLVFQPRHIAVHQRLHVGIGAGRDAALILPQFSDHFGGDGNRKSGRHACHDRRRCPFMRGVAVGVQEADRRCLYPGIAQGFGRGFHLRRVQRRHDAPVAVHPFADLQPIPARHQRLWILQKQVVNVVALLGAHLQQVTKAARRDQAERRSVALDDRVGHQRGAVQDFAHRR